MSAPLLHLLGDRESDASPASIGGKAASLEHMHRAGLPTAPGFCLTIAAHALYMDDGGLRERAAELRAKLPSESARAALTDLMFATPMPRMLLECLDRGLHVLTVSCNTLDRLAVRSSAVHEDGSHASFAGQHDTILGASPRELQDAVRRCWASLWTPRSIDYRRTRGLPFDDGLMAVIVQPLLDAEVSAVVFTSNPMTADREEIVIAAARGLGERLVQGTGDAATLIVNRSTLQTSGADGLLDRALAQRLVELSLRVEREVGRPVDVEAALVERRWLLLQARPITTIQLASSPQR